MHDPIELELFKFLRARLEGDKDPLARLKVARALNKSRLSDRWLNQLILTVEQAGPLELPHLVPLFAQSADVHIGSGFVRALERSPGTAALSAAEVKKALAGYPPAVHDQAKELLARLESAALDVQLAVIAQHSQLLSGRDLLSWLYGQLLDVKQMISQTAFAVIAMLGRPNGDRTQ